MNLKNHLDDQSLPVLFLIFQLKACMYIKPVFNYGFSHVSFGNIGEKIPANDDARASITAPR
jgi:hypothetical protein